ncbi:MAG: Flp pilus assembly complex ATPase component TadA, partial [Phycisphaerales bacterium]|nr:Flp pilus assembly complex ATPase component TadA [Phycisphaerales bacterium]
DLASRNGTFVNNQPIKSMDLVPGDVIRIGSTQIQILDHPVDIPNSSTPSEPLIPAAFVKAADHAEKLLHDLDMPVTQDTPASYDFAAMNASPSAEPAPALEAEAMPSIDAPPKPAPPMAASAAASPVPPSAPSVPPVRNPAAPPSAGLEFEPAPLPTSKSGSSGSPGTPGSPGGPRHSVEVAEDVTQPAAFRRGMEFTGGRDQSYDNIGQNLGSVADQERRLRAILDDLDEQALAEKDIVFNNARGQKMKMPQTSEPGTHQGADAVVLLRLLLLLCARTGASDIHLEPKRDHAFLRVRIDGMMVETVRISPEMAQKIVGVVKVLADLDITQKPSVQDSHFSAEHDGRRVDYRVSFAPSMYGQSLVIRVLDMKNVPSHIKELGMPTWMSQTISQTVQQDQGMLICCGPTGSGKTTTLYAALAELNSPDTKLLTVEDPVEYDIEGLVQLAVNADVGLTFSKALRSFLRQDPDIILVGETRDIETAQIAVQASLTGHLVFTTLHTNDAPSSIARLLDLGLEPFLVTATLEGIVAQRLVRKICARCKEPYTPSEEELMELQLTPEDTQGRQFYRGKGCDYCNHTGYKGRVGLYEIMVLDDDLRELIMHNASTQVLRAEALKRGMRTLRHSGLLTIYDGVTTSMKWCAKPSWKIDN